MTENFSPAEIEKLLQGETITVSTQLESTNGEPISIECYIIPTPSERKWILVTAAAGQVAIGFIDARYFPEPTRGVVEAPHLSRSGAFDVPHTSIRLTSGDDGFFVIEKERNRGVGQVLFDTLKKLLVGLGATNMTVEQPKENSRGFYEKNGGVSYISGYWMPLVNDSVSE